MDFLKLFIKSVWHENTDVIGIELINEDENAIKDIQPGAHIKIQIGNQINKFRQYSLINAPYENKSYLIAIKLEPLSRGGSQWMHTLKPHDVIFASGIKNFFHINEHASKSILVAGGIGITPILSMAQALYHEGKSFELHYFLQDIDKICFINRLETLGIGRNVFIHSGLDHIDIGLKLRNITSDPNHLTHLYCCGPNGLMNLVEDLTSKNWPTSNVHFERFKSDIPNPLDDSTFTVITKKTGFECEVSPTQSIVEALSEVGCAIETSCEQGVCGVCLTDIISGDPEHRDAFLSKSEKLSNSYILPCVSRSKSKILVLDI